MDLETIDDDLDQEGEAIYCPLLFRVTLSYLLLTHVIFCHILLQLHFVTTTFCYNYILLLFLLIVTEGSRLMLLLGPGKIRISKIFILCTQ